LAKAGVELPKKDTSNLLFGISVLFRDLPGERPPRITSFEEYSIDRGVPVILTVQQWQQWCEMDSKFKQQLSPPGVGIRPRSVRWTSTQIVEVQRQILRAAGHDPAIVPDMPFRFLTQREVRELLGLSTASIYRGMAAGKIPRPITIDGITTHKTAARR
jgi:predicted DNA-binding transcriptional regulator AlpA